MEWVGKEATSTRAIGGGKKWKRNSKKSKLKSFARRHLSRATTLLRSIWYLLVCFVLGGMRVIASVYVLLCVLCAVYVCETMFLFHLLKLLLYGIWRIRSIYTHIHSISFLIVCSFSSFFLRSLRSFFPVGYFILRATLFALSHLIRFFSFLLSFSFHFPGQYRLAFASYHFVSLAFHSIPIFVFSFNVAFSRATFNFCSHSSFPESKTTKCSLISHSWRIT